LTNSLAHFFFKLVVSTGSHEGCGSNKVVVLQEYDERLAVNRVGDMPNIT